MPRARGPWVWLGAVVVLGAALRLYELGARSFWYDEAVTVLLLRRDLGDMLATIPDTEGSPPLYYVLAWLWSQVFGTSEWGVRSFTVLVGLAAIPVVFLVARRLGGDRAGLVGALLAAVSPQLVWHAQDARSYALLLLFSACSLLAFLRAVERPTGGRLAVWVLASAVAMASPYFAGFLVLGEAAWLVWRCRSARVVAAACAAGLAGLGLAPIAIEQSDHAGGFLAGVPLTRRLGQVAVEPVVGYQPPAQLVVVAIGAVIALAALCVIAGRTPRGALRPTSLPLALGALVLVVPVLLVPLGHDWVSSRNLLAAWPPIAAALAVLLTRSRAGLAVVGAYAVLAVAIVVATADRSKFDHDDWRTAFAAVGAPEGPRAWVMNPRQGRATIEVYRPDSRPAHNGDVTVGEIEVVLMPSPFRRIGEVPDPPRGYAVRPPAGFREAGRREAATFTLIRLQAARPTRVPVATLARLADRPTLRNAVAVES